MRSAFLSAPYRVEIRDVPDLPAPAQDEALVRVIACGVCGSDINEAETAREFAPFGHELAGVVEAVGSAVTGLAPGDRVAMESSSFCGVCDNCRNGHPELCTDKLCPPFSGFSEKILAKAKVFSKIGSLSYEEAAIIEPMGVAMDLVMVADIKLNDTVVVFGAGAIGIMAIRLAKLKGAGRIIVCARSHSAKRIELAKAFGADEVICTDLEDPVEVLRGRTVQQILVTTPPAVLPAACEIACFGGTISVIGIARTQEDSMVPLDINKMHFKRLQLRFSHATPALFFPLCRDLIESGQVEVKKLISHRFPLEEMDRAFETLRDDKANTVKVLMVAPESEEADGGRKKHGFNFIGNAIRSLKEKRKNENADA